MALTGLFIGAGGMLGYVSNLIEIIPIAVLAPVMVFVSMGITVQSFQAVPARHAAAVAFCFFPSIARMLTIELSKPEFIPGERLSQLMLPAAHSSLPAIVVLGNGFIVTATLWGAFVVETIDKRLRAAAAYLAAAAFLSLFGIIHSVRLDGSSYLFWELRGPERALALQLSLAYLTLAAALLLLSRGRSVSPAPGSPGRAQG